MKRSKSTYKILTVRVKLSSVIVSLDVDLGLVDETSDLDIIWGLDVLNTLEGAVGDDTSTATSLSTPSNLLTLSVRDSRVGLGRCPETEVCGRSQSRRVNKGIGT